MPKTAEPGTTVLELAWGKRLKLRAEGSKLWAEGDKLRAEGDKLWAEAIIEAHGNITLQWVWRAEKAANACELGTGEVFEP